MCGHSDNEKMLRGNGVKCHADLGIAPKYGRRGGLRNETVKILVTKEIDSLQALTVPNFGFDEN